MQAFTDLAAKATENLSPGQASGSGTSGGSGTGTTSPSAGSSGSATSGNGASGTLTNSPAQNTANAAPVLSSQSVFSLGAAALAVFAMW